MNTTQVKVAIVFGVIFLLVVIISVFISSTSNDNLQSESVTDNNTLVTPNIDSDEKEDEVIYFDAYYLTDHIRYVSLNTVSNIYYSYISSRDSGIVNILSSKFKSDNNVTSSNVYNYIDELNGNYTAEILEVKVINITDSFTAYFLKVNVVEDIINVNYSVVDKFTDYIAVYYDGTNLTYSVRPIDEVNYNLTNSSDSEILSLDSNINTGKNTYTTPDVTDRTIATLYFNNFKTNYFYSDDFTKLMANGYKPNIEITEYTSIVDYLYNRSDSTLTIIDELDNTYIFKINYVMNYKVTMG